MGWTTSRRWRRRIDIIPDFCSVVGRGGRGGFALLARKSHRTSRHSMKPHGSTPTYVGIVRVHSAYSNQQILKIPNCVLTSYVDSMEESMHTKGFRYAKCTFGSVGTTNVYLNPG